MHKRNLIRKTALALALGAALGATAALAQTPYDEGQKALREQSWMEAARHFAKDACADRSVACDVVTGAMPVWKNQVLVVIERLLQEFE